VANLIQRADQTEELPYGFEPRGYQIPFYQYMETRKTRQKAFLLEHRRAGKDLHVWNWVIKASQLRVGTYWHMLPKLNQGKRVIWQGKTKEGKSFLDFIPPSLIASKREDEMSIKMNNGSIIQIVGADKYDSLVGANPVGVVFSEFALMNPASWEFIRPILNENDGWAVFVTTPRGRNHAYDLFKNAANNPEWFCQLLTVKDTTKVLTDDKGTPVFDEQGKRVFVPVINEAMVQEERDSGMPEEMIEQEYYCSFDAALVGAYYGQHIALCEKEGRIKTVPYNKEHKVYTSWDIGISDAMSVWYFQVYDGMVHLIEYNEFENRSLIEVCHIVQMKNNLEGLDGIDPELKNTFREKYKHHKAYDFGKHFGPHDVNTREITSGISRRSVARQHGITFQILPRAEVIDGINLARKMFHLCEFDLDNTVQGVRALKDYQKEWNASKFCYNDKPLHNWASHGSDGFRGVAVAVTRFIDKDILNRIVQTVAETEYSRISPHERQVREMIELAEGQMKFKKRKEAGSRNGIIIATTEYNRFNH